ncbi:MAG: hypothetical protein ACI88G_000403, partial [Woeseiaceae bacterium]
DRLDADGHIQLPEFITSKAIRAIQEEGERKETQAYYCVQKHNVYLRQVDSQYDAHHVRNRNIDSSKGCLTDDQVDADSPLRQLYQSPQFRNFLCFVLDQKALYEYADSLASINLHFAAEGQELGWHFDNSSFAITIMIRAPEAGGKFEYINDMRDSASADMNFSGVEKVLDGNEQGTEIEMDAGTLLLFRGRDAIHRVTPVTGKVPRMLATFAYNGEPGIALSESARMTFFGRLE